MKKLLLNLFLLAVGISTGFAQTYKKDVVSPFFETVSYQGAFPVSGGTYSINLYGQTIKNSDGSTWNNNGNWTTGWTNWDPQNAVYPGDNGYAGPSFVDGGTKSGDITANQTWGADNQLTLIKISGAIHVTNGATLTIKPNTIIRGDASNISFLLVTKGAKLNAIGFPDKPIIFTSNKAPGSRTSGDWAGFLLMGKSQNNTSANGSGVRRFEALPSDPLSEYGGGANFDIHDNSGECRFLRVEFAGYNYLPDQEINGVTFGAVGDGTRFDFCQVSFSRDDSYEWFGGSCDHKYLVAWAGIDDEFDQDEGYQGRLQFILGVRKHDVFETSAGGSSHGFEHDNNTGWGTSSQNVVGVNNPQPSTRPVISNASIIGPRIGGTAPGTGATFIPNIAGNRFNAGMAFRTGDESNVYNSIITGYPRQFEYFHNSASLQPSAQQKIVGISDVSGSLTTTGYVKNEVIHTFLLTDVNDNRSGKGTVNGAIVESQAQPAAPLDNFDPATGIYLPTGTLMDNTGVFTQFNIGSFGNASSIVLTAAQIFTQPIYYSGTSLPNGTPMITVPDFTLVNSAPGLVAPSFAVTALANNILTANSFAFAVSPSALPNLIAPTMGQSASIRINVTTFGLTSAGINASLVSATNFQISSDGITYGTSDINISTIGGSIFVRYASTASVAGSNTGTLTITPADGRATPVSINLTGQSISPAVPFVQASAYQLPDFNASGIGSLSSTQTFTISGNLLQDVVTVTSSLNFSVSKDGANWGSSIIYTPSFRLLAPAVVYVKYTPTVANNVLTAGGVNASGNDMGSVSISSPGAITESVIVNGAWGYNAQVGFLQADGTIFQFVITPALPTYNSFLGVPSASQRTYVAAQNIPAGQNLAVRALSGMEFSTDNVTFTPSLSIAPVSGNVAPTAIYLRADGKNALPGGNAQVAVGLSGGNAVLDKLIGVQGTNRVAPTAIAGGTVTTTGIDNTVLGTNTTFLSKLKPGVALYIGGVAAANFAGVVTSVIDDNTATLDRTVTTLNTSASVAATATNAPVINALTNSLAANKDFNRGAIVFPLGDINGASSFDVNSQAPIAVTISGYWPITTYGPIVGRDFSTEYALRYEVSADKGATWVSYFNASVTGGVIVPQEFWVRYNPTGTNVIGNVANSPLASTLPGFGQHTGSILVGATTITGAYNGPGYSGGVIMYTVGYSDPILYASSSWLSTLPGFDDVVPTINDEIAISNTTSAASAVYIYGKRLQSDITVTPSNTKFLVSADGTTWNTSLTLSRNATNNFTGKIWVKYSPDGSVSSETALINISTTKASQSLNIKGIDVPTPTAYITTSGVLLNITAGGVSQSLSVGGANLVAPLVVTAPANFMINGGAGFVSSLTLTPNTLNYGYVTGSFIVTFTGATNVSGSVLSLASAPSLVNVTLSGIAGSTITGITEFAAQASEVAIYPNPTENGEVTIVAPANAAITIYSLSGTVLYSGVANEGKTQVSGLASGFNIVRVGTKTFKLLVK